MEFHNVRLVLLTFIMLLHITVSTAVNYENAYAPSHHEYKDQDYKFSYGVKDPHTGDIKQHWEKKEAGTVTGSYSLVEADGRVRIVDYSADKHTGFTATVKHKGVAKHPEPIKHPHAYLPHQATNKPVSFNDYNLKIANHVQESGHYIQPHLPTQGNNYEIKYVYPSELKQYEEHVAAPQQYDVAAPQQYEVAFPKHLSIPQVTEAIEGEDEYKGSESAQQKQVHYYVPKVFENVDSKPEESAKKFQPHTLPYDIQYVKQPQTPEIPTQDALNDQYSQIYVQPTLNKGEVSNNLLQNVYAVLKESYNFSPPQLEQGFKPLVKTPEKAKTKAETSPGLGHYSSSNSKVNMGLTKNKNYEFETVYQKQLKIPQFDFKSRLAHQRITKQDQ